MYTLIIQNILGLNYRYQSKNIYFIVRTQLGKYMSGAHTHPKVGYVYMWTHIKTYTRILNYKKNSPANLSIVMADIYRQMSSMTD